MTSYVHVLWFSPNIQGPQERSELMMEECIGRTRCIKGNDRDIAPSNEGAMNCIHQRGWVMLRYACSSVRISAAKQSRLHRKKQAVKYYARKNPLHDA